VGVGIDGPSLHRFNHRAVGWVIGRVRSGPDRFGPFFLFSLKRFQLTFSLMFN
jgi:hypothetical protein